MNGVGRAGRIGYLGGPDRSQANQLHEAGDPVQDPGDEEQVVGITADRAAEEEAARCQEEQAGLQPTFRRSLGFGFMRDRPVNVLDAVPQVSMRRASAPATSCAEYYRLGPAAREETLISQ